jgi:exosome complex exonuclease RRP6
VQKKAKSNFLDPSHRRANIPKPQLAFERKVDNFSEPPWKPLLTTKPNALVPLEESLQVIVAEDGSKQ